MILVTGGSGLLGKEVITQLLAQGKKVTAIYNKTPLPAFNSPLLIQYPCNILDVAGLEELMQQGIEQIYHCAAIVTFDLKRKQELFKVNIEGTANVVNAAVYAGIKKMVHVSSVAALGRKNDKNPITENISWTDESSKSNYGESKHLGELEVWRGIGEGLDAVIVNPTIILGVADWNTGSAQIFKSVYNEFPWYTDGITGFVDVKDVAAIMLQLMDSDISAQRFIISATNKSYQQIFNLIATAFNKKLPGKRVTPFLARIIWRLEAFKSTFSGKPPLVTKETTNNALAKNYFDNSKLKKYLPQFKYRNIEETISNICAAFQQKINSR